MFSTAYKLVNSNSDDDFKPVVATSTNKAGTACTVKACQAPTAQGGCVIM